MTTRPRLKTATERSLFGGVLVLIGNALATVAQTWGTPEIWPVAITQLAAVLAGVGLLVDRQRRSPSVAVSKTDAEIFRADAPRG